MNEIKIPKLPVPPASWKLDRALAPSTGQPESAAQPMQALDRPEIAQALGGHGSWGAPEYMTVGSIIVPTDRLPVDKDVVEAIVATIRAGNVNALPPIHVWRKQTGDVPILVAGGNRLEGHKRAGCETILARAIYGDTPEIARAVEATEIEENLHRRELSPALRKIYTTRLKALHEQEHPKSKGGRPSKTVPKAGMVSKPERFTKAHAKRTGRSEAAVQQDVAEATALGDDVMAKIVGTALDKQTEITALAAMEEQERKQTIDRAVAGETVSAAGQDQQSLAAAKGGVTVRTAHDSEHMSDANEEIELEKVIARLRLHLISAR